MTQKDAVYSAVVAVLSNNNVTFEPGVSNANDLLTKAYRGQVTDRLVSGFQNGSVDISDEAKSKLSNNAELRAYVSGLISNWVRKDSRLNGGTTPVKRPRPSKSATSDPQLKALNQLLKAESDESKRNEIQSFINNRTAELSQ